MKIAIHNNKWSFTKDWIRYCQTNKLDYTIVNCYDHDIVNQLKAYDFLFWYVSHDFVKDMLSAKNVIFALENLPIKVFPDFKSIWHFDDKVAQKYLFDSLSIKTVNTYTFYDKNDALNWTKNTTFPKVFKLTRGASSVNVKLAKDKNQANKLIQKAFRNGFNPVSRKMELLNRYKYFKQGKVGIGSLLKGIGKVFIKSNYEKTVGREINYAYFQDFIPKNDSDYRIIVIDDRCYGYKRFTRKNDFRASGSGQMSFDPKEIPVILVEKAFKISKILKMHSIAFDFIFLEDEPLLIEISYCFGRWKEEGKFFWDKDLTLHNAAFNIGEYLMKTFINKKQ